MRFLFHTVITWPAQPVYYSVLERDSLQYLAQLLDNPHAVQEAQDFIFWFENEWQSDLLLPGRELEILGEEVEHFRRKTVVSDHRIPSTT